MAGSLCAASSLVSMNSVSTTSLNSLCHLSRGPISFCRRREQAVTYVPRLRASHSLAPSPKQCKPVSSHQSVRSAKFTASIPFILHGWEHPSSVRNYHLGNAFAAENGAGVSVDKNELLKDAAKSGDLSTVADLMLSDEVDVNLPSPLRSGWTALHLGAYYEHTAIIEALLKAGANTEVRNHSGNTALQFACLKGNLEIVKLLLAAGADVHATSNDKGSALDYAQEWGGEEVVEFLLLWAANQNA